MFTYLIRFFQKLSGLALYVVNHWPMMLYTLQKMFLVACLIALLVLIGELLYVFLTPGVLESMGLISLVVQPPRLNLIATNDLIIQNAWKINTFQVYNVETVY